MASRPRHHDTESWKVGFATYMNSYEVRLHRRLKTYGGKMWPPDAAPGRITQERQLEIAIAAAGGTP